MSQNIDQRIKQAQRKGISVYLLTGALLAIVLVSFLLWLFFIRTYTVLVGPSDATLASTIKADSSLAWVTGNKVYTLGSKLSLSISAPTFQSKTLNIDSNSPVTIEVILLPLPANINATLTLNTQTALNTPDVLSDDPTMQTYLDGTQWYLNGQLISVGRDFNYSTPPGEYQLLVSNPFFHSEPVDLSLNRAEDRSLELTLNAAVGSLTLKSEPTGAKVTLNGKVVGNTPYNAKVVTGKYNVLIEKDSMQSITETIDVQLGFLDQARNYQLLPKQAQLEVKANPSDGVLLINNVEYPTGLVSLSSNQLHQIEYSKPGFRTFSKSINLKTTDLNKLEIKLEKTFGKLTLVGNVPAEIKVNGQARGSLPTELTLNTVLHNLEFSYPGYRAIKRSVTPKDNHTLAIQIEMLTEFDARRKEGKPLFVNQLGINMLRFSASEFVMGSPPNETGRRRNEHQVKVDFNNQFWVSDKEITQAQYSAFAGQKVNSNLPVTGVSWLEAAQFCNWLSENEGLPLFYRFANGRYLGVNKEATGYRMPTEAEWEWVAKKSKRATSTIFVWGNQTKLRDNQGNYADKSMQGKQLIIFDDYQDGQAGIAPVGSYKADRSGLYDLDGNVSEWVHDFYTNDLPDTSKTHVDYLGLPSGDAWVIKGGNFETGRLRELRASFREFSSQGKVNLGFRIARYQN